jgi:hypothetical protein
MNSFDAMLYTRLSAQEAVERSLPDAHKVTGSRFSVVFRREEK